MCQKCGWDIAKEEIEEMLDDPRGRYDFASKTLSGIRTWIRENHHVTDKQALAVDRIRNSQRD